MFYTCNRARLTLLLLVPFDGLMGMGTDKLSNQKVPVFATAAKAAGVIVRYLLQHWHRALLKTTCAQKSAQLGYSLDSITDDVNESQLSVGGVDASKSDFSFCLQQAG